jgi:hypothetical protein
MRHEDPGASITYRGVAYTSDASGVFTIPVALVPTAIDHGFLGPIPEEVTA